MAIEDGVDGMGVYASSFGEVFSPPFPITQRTCKKLDVVGQPKRHALKYVENIGKRECRLIYI